MSIDGHAITALTEEDLPVIRRWLGLLPKGRELRCEVIRDEERLTIAVAARAKGEVEGQEYALERFDFTVKEINQFDNPDLFFHRQKGVFVFGVKRPGNAASAGLRARDIILKIDGAEVETIDEVKTVHERLVASVDQRHRVLIVVLRGGLMRQIVLDFGRDYSKE